MTPAQIRSSGKSHRPSRVRHKMASDGTSGAASLSVVGLFAGIGGLELGFQRSGHEAELLCEIWHPARTVLEQRFPDVPLHDDVRTLRSLPTSDVVAAGFPCTDLSQAGRTAGISGSQSGLIGEVFRLLETSAPTWLVLENVRNMLVLDGGHAMEYLVRKLECLGYRWAYRLVDSRSFGVPQRRQRVILVASKTEDPRTVLFADDARERRPSDFRSDAFGFYWTEGLRGLGWARDAVPTLKGGSTVGIPSPPAIWWPAGPRGGRVVVPSVEEAEQLQGFRAGWTAPGSGGEARHGARWKLVGNALTVGVATWLGHRLCQPGEPYLEGAAIQAGDSWPTAAFGAAGKAWRVDISMWPVHQPYRHLSELVALAGAQPLSAKATGGFLSRARRSSLRFAPGFLTDLEEHVEIMSRGVSIVA